MVIFEKFTPRYLLSPKQNEDCVSSVSRLFFSRGPEAIVGVVPSGVIAPFKGVFFSGFLAEIRKEIDKSVWAEPSRAYGYISLLVVAYMLFVYPFASSQHGIVGSIFGALLTFSMGFRALSVSYPGFNFFFIQTTAAFGETTSQSIGGVNFDRPANALAYPSSTPTERRRLAKYRPPIEMLSD